MLRQIVIVSAFVSSAVLGAIEELNEETNTMEIMAPRRRSEDADTESSSVAETVSTVEQHYDAVWAIAVYAGFRFRRCAHALPAWNTPAEKMYIRIYAGALHGIFVNLESDNRRRFGFNVNNFLYNVAERLSNTCENGEEAVVSECRTRTVFLMNLNIGKSLAEFTENFAQLTDGTDGLIECALAEVRQICTDYYEELCLDD